MKSSHLIASMFALLALAAANPARATIEAPVTETYEFTGICTETNCPAGGTVHAQLVLQGYSLGDDITSSEFVSFVYDGSNLQHAFTVTPSELQNIGGLLPTSLPGPAVVDLTFVVPGVESDLFSSHSSGSWSLETADSGDNGVWQGVPEPSTWALMLLGFAGLGFAAHRRAKKGRAALAPR